MNGVATYESSEEDYETEVMLYDRSKTRKIRHHLSRVDPTYDDEDNTSLRPLMQHPADDYFDKEGLLSLFTLHQLYLFNLIFTAILNTLRNLLWNWFFAVVNH